MMGRFKGFIALGALFAGLAQANAPANITPGEVARLPPYCPDAQLFSSGGSPDNPTPRQREWVSRMGRAFWAIHHYCWAQISANRAMVPGVTKQQRDYLYSSAFSDSFYVIQNSDPGFVLLPEILTRMGDFKMELGKPFEAVQMYDRARQERPDYWPPYLRLAEMHEKAGRRQAAIEILTEGVKNVPGEARLVTALRRLGGTVPAAPPPAAPASAASATP